MYQKLKERKPYELLNTSKYPPEVAGRFNSFITTQFDDSLSVEMQMRSIIKWAIDNFKHMDDTYNEFTEHIIGGSINPFIEFLNDLIEYMNEFIETFDERYQETILVKMQEWYDNGELETLINESLDTKYHEMDNRLTTKLAQTDKDIEDRGINLNTSFPIQPLENNDSPRIQRAIDSLGMNGGLLFFPEGVYELSEPVTFDARNLMLTGMGRKSVLRPSESFTGNSLIRSLHATDRTRLNALENVIIERLTFDGREKEIIGILITGFTRGSSIRDNTFNNFEGSSIHLSGSWSYSIERNNITGSNKNGTGLNLGNGGYGDYDNSGVVNQSRIVGNSIRGHEAGINIGYGNNNLIHGNTVELNKRDLMSISSNSLVVTGNYFEACTIESIRLGGVSSTVKDSIFQGNFFFKGEEATAEFNLVGLENTIISNNQYYPTGRIMAIPETRGLIENNTIEIDTSRVFGLQHINPLNTIINTDTNTINRLNIGRINNVLTDSLKVDLTGVRSLETIPNGLKVQGTSPRFELNGIAPTGEDGSTGEFRMVSEDGTTLARLGKISSGSNNFSMFLEGLDKFLFNKDVQINAPVGFNGVEPKTKRTITGSTDTEKLDSIIQVLKDFGLVE